MQQGVWIVYRLTRDNVGGLEDCNGQNGLPCPARVVGCLWRLYTVFHKQGEGIFISPRLIILVEGNFERRIRFILRESIVNFTGIKVKIDIEKSNAGSLHRSSLWKFFSLNYHFPTCEYTHDGRTCVRSREVKSESEGGRKKSIVSPSASNSGKFSRNEAFRTNRIGWMQRHSPIRTYDTCIVHDRWYLVDESKLWKLYGRKNMMTVQRRQLIDEEPSNSSIEIERAIDRG